MNTSHLSKADLCKALSDAAEYNKIKAQIKLSSTYQQGTAQVHLDFATRLQAECKRLQKGGQ